MKLRIITFSFLLLAPFITGAQDKIENDGGPGMLFSGIIRDPISLAMGGAAAVPDGSSAYAAFNNPTSMWMKEDRFQAGISYMKNLPHEATVGRGMNVGASFKFNKVFAAALGFSSGWSPSYDILDINGDRTGRSFSPKNTIVCGGFSARIVGEFTIGANVRYLSQSLSPDFKEGALASDVFASFKLKDFFFTAGVSNLKLAGKDPLPSTATLAVRYSRSFGLHRISASGEFDQYFNGASQGSLGASYTYRDFVTVRTGYRLCGNNAPYPSRFSAGLGLKFRFLCLDAAFLPEDGSFSVGVRVVL